MKTIHVSGDLLKQPLILTMTPKEAHCDLLDIIGYSLKTPLERHYIYVTDENGKKIELEDMNDGQNVLVKQYPVAMNAKIESRLNKRKANREKNREKIREKRKERRRSRAAANATAKLLCQLSVGNANKEHEGGSEDADGDEEMGDE